MMKPAAAVAARLAGPHRGALSFLVGAALAFRARGGPDEALVGAVVLALTLPAISASRLWAGGWSDRPTSWRFVAAGLGVAAVTGLLTVLSVRGAWLGVVVVVLIGVVEWVAFAPPLALAKKVPIELFALVVEGALVPVLGYTVVAGGWGVPWSLLVVTVPAAAAIACASFLQRQPAEEVSFVVLRGVVHPLVVSVGGLAAASLAIGFVVSGLGPDLRPELALLAVPVAVIATVFGWLALVDPKASRRDAHAEYLLTVAGIALPVGLIVVLTVA